MWVTWSFLFLFASLLLQPKSFAQDNSTSSQSSTDDDDSDTPWTSLTIEFNSHYPASVYVATSDASAPTDISQKYDFVQAIAETLGCNPTHIHKSNRPSHAEYLLSAQCDVPLNKSLLSRRGTLNFNSLKKIQSAEPDRQIIVSLYVDGSNILDCGSPKTSPDHLRSYCSYFAGTVEPSIIPFEYGYTQSRALLIAAVLAPLLAIPLVLTLIFRRRAAQVSEEAKPSISFAYRRFVTRTALVGSLVWWAALDILQVDALAAFAIPFSKINDPFASTVLLWSLLWLPAVLIYFLCLVLSSPMLALRGIARTPQEAWSQSFWSVGRVVFPVAFAVLGAGELFYSPRAGVLFFAACIVSGKIVNRKIVRGFGFELHALTSGELRDRAFALAKVAGAKLNQLYVFPAARMRMANAFAHAAQNVYLTDYLLQNLNKSEVDAVVGHEIAHLQKKHVSQRVLVTIVLMAAIGFATGFLERSVPHWVPSGPILYAAFLLLFMILSRRNEFAADAGSAKITGNAEAMITALARITRLNTMPLHWTKLDEKLLTHPSTLRRVKRLAQGSGISEARLSQLLTESIAPSHDTYSIPATALPSGKIFSSQYKKRIAGRLAWAGIATSSLVPAILALGVKRLDLSGGTLWFAYLAAFLLTIFLTLLVSNFVSMTGNRKLEDALRKKFGSGTASGGNRGRFVGFSPDSVPRIYEWNWSWDLGLIELEGDRLVYRGEETSFALSRSEITSIALGPGPVGWLSTPSIYIAWRGSDGHSSTFNLRTMDAGSLLKMAVKTRSLAQDLQNWQQGSLASTNQLFSSTARETVLRRPPIGQVTSMSPRKAVQSRNLVAEFFLNTLVAVGVILVFGLGFPLFTDFKPPDAPIDLNPDYSGLCVLLVVWAVRIFLLIPYWRVREEPDAPASAVGAAVPGTGSNI